MSQSADARATSRYSAILPGSFADITLDRARVVRIFLILLAIKAFISLVLFPEFAHYLGANYKAELFQDEYDKIAENLAQGRGYRVYDDTSPTMLRSPGFVVLLAGIFYLVGKSLFAVQVVQYFMSAGTAVLVYLIAQRLIASRVVSLAAATIYLFHPIVLISDSRGGVDTTLMLCMAGAIWMLYRAIDTNKIRDFTLLGLTVGYTMLVKPSVALIFPLVFVYLLIAPVTAVSFTRLFRNFAIAGLVAGLVMAPWVVRNYAVSGEFVPTMTVGGLAAFQGVEVVKHSDNGEPHLQLLDDAAAKQMDISREMGLKSEGTFFPAFYDVHDELNFYNELGRRAWDDYKADPALLMRAIVHNSWAFWLQGRTPSATAVNMVVMLPFLLLSVFGAVLIIRRQRSAWILPIAIIAFMLPHLVIIALARHCSTVIPLMAILTAGCFLMPMRHSVRKTRYSAQDQTTGSAIG